MGKNFSHLNMHQRWAIEKLLNERYTITYIAKVLNVNKSTVSREIKRGTWQKQTPELKNIYVYNADVGERVYKENRKRSFNKPKYKEDEKLMQIINNKILYEKYSPRAVNFYLKYNENKDISYSTIYRYIKHKYFLNLRIRHLPNGNIIKYEKIERIQKRKNAGTNIFYREDIINQRQRFGDWEMDCVEGKKKYSKNIIFNLTERKTRATLLFKLDKHSSDCIVDTFDYLENIFQDDFKIIFKSITTDNGNEFSAVEEMEKSILNKNIKRTKIFYCDAYKPYQKGTVENQNRLIRRFIKKGTNFDDKNEKEIEAIKSWINNYYRKIFNGKTSYEELKKEFINNNINIELLKYFK